MTLKHEYSSASVVWISAVSMALGVIMAVIAVATFTGRLDARITSLEAATDQTMPRGEWQQFEKDITSRLDRIENKLDTHMTAPR